MSESKTVLVLCAVDKYMQASNGFTYPESGYVKCDNWLHGLLWGSGKGESLYLLPDTIWFVLEVKENLIAKLDNAIRFSEGYIVFRGRRNCAANYIKDNGGKERVAGTIVTTGNCGPAIAGEYDTAITGDYNIASVGNYGRAIAGNHSKAEAGNHSVAIAGELGHAEAGNYSYITVGKSGRAEAGNYSNVIAEGENGYAKVGNHSVVKIGKCSHALAGCRSYIEADCYSTIMAGINSIVRIKYYNRINREFEYKIDCIGENGLEPNTIYCIENGEWVEDQED